MGFLGLVVLLCWIYLEVKMCDCWSTCSWVLHFFLANCYSPFLMPFIFTVIVQAIVKVLVFLYGLILRSPKWKFINEEAIVPFPCSPCFFMWVRNANCTDICSPLCTHTNICMPHGTITCKIWDVMIFMCTWLAIIGFGAICIPHMWFWFFVEIKYYTHTYTLVGFSFSADKGIYHCTIKKIRVSLFIVEDLFFNILVELGINPYFPSVESEKKKKINCYIPFGF